jgi:superfamily II DNA helicase RecQ
VHWFHASTGERDKKDVINGYENSNFPCVSCTMALGLGKNWKHVRSVIHMGRGDPSSINQMVGRCGRDGRLALAIMFMEKKRKYGKNKPEDFSNIKDISEDNRMDMLAVTPICLRIAFSLDNL